MGGLCQSSGTALAQADKQQHIPQLFFSLLNSLSLQIPCVFLLSFIHQLLKPGEMEAPQPSGLLSNHTNPFL